MVIKHKPRTVVFYAGDNDIASGKTPPQVDEAFRVFVGKVHSALPETRVAFIAIKPSIQRWALVAKVREANALVRAFCGTDDRLAFVDVDGPMLGWDEQPRKDLFVEDGLHLSARGYELWTTLVRPFVENRRLQRHPRDVLGLRAPSPHRSAPTMTALRIPSGRSIPRTRLVIACFAALLLVAQSAGEGLRRTSPEDVGMSSSRLQRLTDTFQAYVKDGTLPGAVVLVARRGKIAYHEAFGVRDRESASPLREDAIFRIASQTKALVSVAVMMLQEEGRLLIGDRVGKYLPEFQKTSVAVPREGGGYDVVPAKRPITIRDLLTHTAGIGYGSGPASDRWKAAGIQGWYFADRDEPIAATISRIAALPFDAQPGEAWVYGYATDILGALVERVSGTTLEEFLRRRILVPLRMPDTHFYLPAAKTDRLAAVYSVTDGKLTRAPDPGGMVGQGAYVQGPRTSFSGGAGLLSTATDYARFLQMLLNGGELDGARILSPASVRLMTVDHLGSIPFRPGQGFGLGFSVVEDLGGRGVPGSVGEFGWGGAYHSTYWVDPAEQLVVVYMTQVIPSGDVDDHGKLRALVYQSLTN